MKTLHLARDIGIFVDRAYLDFASDGIYGIASLTPCFSQAGTSGLWPYALGKSNANCGPLGVIA
jgi:hypothetical protein